MRRAILAGASALLLSAIPAVADPQPSGSSELHRGAVASPRDITAPAETDREKVDLASAATAAQSPRRPVFRSTVPRRAARRRGSMVGYIDDAIVQSRIRIRFDTAYHNTVPDRAEFFYAKCGCYRDLPRSNAAFDPDAPGPRPGAASDVNFQQLYLEGELALDPRVSVFGQVPIRWLQPQAFVPGTGAGFPNQRGMSDLRVGAKASLLESPTSALVARLQAYFPTGDAARGLGTNHGTVEPSLLLAQDLSPVIAIESQLGVWLPVGGSEPVPTSASGRFAGRVFYYGVGPSVTVYQTDRVRFAPVVELVGWRVQAGNQSAEVTDAAGTNIVNLKFGARLTIDRGSVYVGYGRALTDATWYDDVLRLEYRYAF